MKKQVKTQSTTPASVNSTAELVYERFYERFLASFPPENALDGQVRNWIFEWFTLDEVYMNDIAVPKFVGHLCLSGWGLRKLSDHAILQYLSIQNVRLYGGPEGQLYPTIVIEKLVGDMLEARRRAIPGWNGVSALLQQDKRKRYGAKSTRSNKRTKLTNTDTGECGGRKDAAETGMVSGRGSGKSSSGGQGCGGSASGKDHTEIMDADNEVLLLTEDDSKSMREREATMNKGQPSTLLTDAESGLGFSLTSLMDPNISSGKGSGKKESADEVSTHGDWQEGDMEDPAELIKKMKRFKHANIQSGPSEPNKSSSKVQHKGHSAQPKIGASK